MSSLETLVYQELRAINHYFYLQYDLYFWQTADKVEVDFILYGPKGIIAIEVKRSSRVDVKDLRGLALFGKDYPEAKRFVFYGGKRREYLEGVQYIPIEEALMTLSEILM